MHVRALPLNFNAVLCFCQFAISFFALVFMFFSRTQTKRKIKIRTIMCKENRSPKGKHQTSCFLSVSLYFLFVKHTTYFFRCISFTIQCLSLTFFALSYCSWMFSIAFVWFGLVWFSWILHGELCFLIRCHCVWHNIQNKLLRKNIDK